MLEVENLCYKVCSRKTDFQIAEISFRLEEGYLMGLFGRNGAGKSTLFRLLYGVLRADRGNVFFQGQNIHGNEKVLRQEIGYLGEEDIFFGNQPVSENVKILGGLYPKYKEEDFLDYLRQFELAGSVYRKSLDELSTGQKKQVQLAFLLSRHPRLLLLDEPVGNLDPVFRVEFMDLLQEVIAKEGISVILSTHLLDDIEDIVDYIGILEQGQMRLFGDREKVMSHVRWQNGGGYGKFQTMGVWT